MTHPCLLCIIAHPDDETMLCGGTLALLAARSVDIHILCATRGEGGEMGDPPPGTREELGRVRETEMRCACQTLGVRGVEFLGYVDPLVGPEDTLYPFTGDEDELRDRLLAHIQRLRPDILLTHGRDGEYGHPAHKLLHRAAWDAFQHLQNTGGGPAYFYTIASAIPGVDDHLFNQSEPADLVYELENTPWLDTKEAAALCHVTQHALFKRRKKAKTVREILRRVESLHRHWPPDGPDAPQLTNPQFPIPGAKRKGTPTLTGIVIKAQSGFFTVQDADGRQVVAQLRGRLKKKRRDTDLIAAGDRVTVAIAEDGSAAVEEIAERERALSRLAPSAKGRGGRRWSRRGYLSEREQVIVANPDEVVFVFSCAEPEPSLRMLDRFLVGAEAQDIPAVVCANKIDLVGGVAGGRELFGLYEEISYPVVYTSALTGEGVEELRDQLAGKLSVLAGPSGVGKSSLLNAMQPGLGLVAKHVSQATGKGRHTTVVPELLPLGVGGWVADTPGLRAIALFDTDPEDLDAYFPEIAPLVAECQFSDCTHLVEPGCAVIAAVKAGEIHPERYESYAILREEHQRLADTYWWGIKE